jgi:hypothetical protein
MTFKQNLAPLFSALIIVAGACAAEPPTNDDFEPRPTETDDGNGGGGGGGGDDTAPAKPALSINSLPTVTEWESVSITGNGPAHGTLVYDSPSRGQFAVDISGDGSFCVDVPLAMETLNKIRLQAISQAGQYSDQVMVEVTQERSQVPDSTEQPGEDGQPFYYNAALAASNIRTPGVVDGVLSSMFDGDVSSTVGIRQEFFAADTVAFQLPELVDIDHLRIASPEECQLEYYEVLVTDEIDPADPTWTEQDGWGEWTVAATVNNKSTEHEITPNLASLKVRHVALHFKSGCGLFPGSMEHRVAEIAVFVRDIAGGTDDPGITDEGPSCSNGGN